MSRLTLQLRHRKLHRAAWLVAATCATAIATPSAIDEPLRATLLTLARDDQDAVRIATADPTRQMDEATARRLLEIHTRNGDTIRRIIKERGWPGISLAGADGSRAAWLVVQHMDEDPAFQKSCLALVEQAFEKGEVNPVELAYLTDRVLTSEGKPQTYGTQGRGVTSLEDERRVDRNRAAIGLGPWREAVEKRKQDYANGYGADIPASVP